jgi:hypothetical protein
MWMSLLSSMWGGICKVLRAVFSFLKEKSAEDKAAVTVVESMREKLAEALQQRITAMDVEFSAMMKRKDDEYGKSLTRREEEHDLILNRRDEDLGKAFKRITLLERAEERCRKELAETQGGLATAKASIEVLKTYLEEAQRVKKMRESIEYQARTRQQTKTLLDVAPRDAETQVERTDEGTPGGG